MGRSEENENEEEDDNGLRMHESQGPTDLAVTIQLGRSCLLDLFAQGFRRSALTDHWRICSRLTPCRAQKSTSQSVPSQRNGHGLGANGQKATGVQVFRGLRVECPWRGWSELTCSGGAGVAPLRFPRGIIVRTDAGSSEGWGKKQDLKRVRNQPHTK